MVSKVLLAALIGVLACSSEAVARELLQKCQSGPIVTAPGKNAGSKAGSQSCGGGLQANAAGSALARAWASAATKSIGTCSFQSGGVSCTKAVASALKSTAIASAYAKTFASSAGKCKKCSTGMLSSALSKVGIQAATKAANVACKGKKISAAKVISAFVKASTSGFANEIGQAASNKKFCTGTVSVKKTTKGKKTKAKKSKQTKPVKKTKVAKKTKGKKTKTAVEGEGGVEGGEGKVEGKGGVEGGEGKGR